jgi:hypothetical protein
MNSLQEHIEQSRRERRVSPEEGTIEGIMCRPSGTLSLFGLAQA